MKGFLKMSRNESIGLSCYSMTTEVILRFI